MRTTYLMAKRTKLCTLCNKEIGQGHNCEGFKGYKAHNRKLAVPRAIEGRYFERIIEGGNMIFLDSGTQPNGKITDYGKSIDDSISRLKKEKKKYTAGTDIGRD